jgi:hypothetical protein
MLGEPHPFPRHLVEPRRGDPALAIRTEVSIPEIIGHDEDDVRRPGRELTREPGGSRNEEE